MINLSGFRLCDKTNTKVAAKKKKYSRNTLYINGEIILFSLLLC